jgi:hypothetical protein
MSTLTTKGGDYALQGNSKREGTAPHQLPREMVLVSGREGIELLLVCCDSSISSINL